MGEKDPSEISNFKIEASCSNILVIQRDSPLLPLPKGNIHSPRHVPVDKRFSFSFSNFSRPAK